MNYPSLLPRFLVRAAIICFVCASAISLPAELIWTPDIGYRVRGEPMREDGSAIRPSTGLMLLTMAREAQERGDLRVAIRHYRSVIEDFSTSIFAPEAHFQSALVRIERKQWTRAFEHFQAIVDSYPDYPVFEEVIHQQYDIAEGLMEGNRLRLFWIIPGFRSKERAVEYFEQVVENAPYSEHAPEALLNAASLQVKRNLLDEAIDLYDRFISDYPDHEKASEAYFGLAETFSTRMKGPEYDQGANREAISYYEDFMLLYPDHPRAPEAEERIQEMQEVLAESRIVLGDFYFYHRDNFPAARIFYNEAISISPVSPTADEAREKLAEVEERAAAQANR